MAKKQYTEPRWSIQSISDNSALILYDAETAYVIGATADTFTLKALQGGYVVEDASACISPMNRSLTVSVTADNSTSRLQAAFDGGCVRLRYLRDNELLLDEETSVLTGYSATARQIATDRQVYEKAIHLRRLLEKIRDEPFFREQVLRSISQFATPLVFAPVDFCQWVCKACWNGMYLPHSCIACIYCNGLQQSPVMAG